MLLRGFFRLVSASTIFLVLSHSMKRRSARGISIASIPRDTVIERMNDGWVVLDSHNRVVDLNPAAERVIGLPSEKIFGQPAEKILADWPNVAKQLGNLRESEIKGSVILQDGRRYLNLRLSPLVDHKGNNFGQLIVWRDVTERRMVEEARQRARDEMFVLLHAISGAASRAMNLGAFLAEANHQVLYSFRSQSSAIFLLEQVGGKSGGHGLSLSVQHGLSDESARNMLTFLHGGELLAHLLEDQIPLLIPDIQNDPRLTDLIRETDDKTLLAMPMVADARPLGIICLTRKEGPAYSKDDMTRLTIVADEIATFITSDRQRQMRIAMAERQRLVRDLHDSVTQKLYGLLALTEAAQAGLEAGTPIMPEQVLSRIGDNTRQALKEMRLFLYGLQPVDLEHEGLISVLHGRLAAVEGRADVKARLIADDKICLPLPKEVALYFVAQEALNNVLRHANAKSVTARLKQTRASILLVIEDDGCGFDPHHANRGGLGLTNMRERVAQIGGRLKIDSVSGKGTKISVSIPRENYSQAHYQRA
jgi:PAS domain S-box-containing protein